MTPDELRQAIKSLGMTQQQAADKMGLHIANLSRQLCGKTAKVSGPVAAAVTAWLEVEELKDKPYTARPDYPATGRRRTDDKRI